MKKWLTIIVGILAGASAAWGEPEGRFLESTDNWLRARQQEDRILDEASRLSPGEQLALYLGERRAALFAAMAVATSVYVPDEDNVLTQIA